ncbi:MAG TPA: DUF6569 family protein [Chthonomonadales bacterium]|nr:DUF6569 family protein [Chthonomonadales bacterium]
MKLIADDIYLGVSGTFKNLTMTPIVGGAHQLPDYITLDQALSSGAAHVTEVSASGSVPDLLFVNEGRSAVFLMDGEELIGAKQNRILSSSILAPAESTITIPVACVEAGRWSHVSGQFHSAGAALHGSARSSKAHSVTHSFDCIGQARADQYALWADLEAKASRMRAASETRSMRHIYDKHSDQLAEYVAAFAPLDPTRGAVFGIGGEIAGMDLFDCPETFETLMPKLLRSYALDALDCEGYPGRPGGKIAPEEFLDSVRPAHTRSHKSAGEGEDVRLVAAGLDGGALVARNRMVHLCAFPAAASAESNYPDEQQGRSRSWREWR